MIRVRSAVSKLGLVIVAMTAMGCGGSGSDAEPLAADASQDTTARVEGGTRDSAFDGMESTPSDSGTATGDGGIIVDGAAGDATPDVHTNPFDAERDSRVDAPFDAARDSLPDGFSDAARDGSSFPDAAEAGCADRCQESTKQCMGAGVATCERGVDGCLAWSAEVACPATTYCSFGACVPSCTNECTDRAVRCTSGGVSSCRVGAAGCTEWSSAIACPAGQSCVNGACKSSSGTLAFRSVASGTTQELWSVWGAAHNDIFAVGKGGTILHYDGTGFTPMASRTTATLKSVWGSSGRDVWAISWETADILHFDGASWTSTRPYADVSYYAVTGSSPNDMWFVGRYTRSGLSPAIAVHWDGSTYTLHEVPAGNGYAAASLGYRKVLVAGYSWDFGTYDGTKWTGDNRGFSGAPWAVISMSDGTAWAAGDNRMIYQYDGASWGAATSPVSGQGRWYGMARVSDSDAWMCGDSGSVARLKGQAWASIPTGLPDTTLYGVYASGPEDAWFVGYGGTVIHYSP